MIVDLERRGGKQMFITEEFASINKNKNGLWTVRFLSSPVCSQSLQTALPHALQNDRYWQKGAVCEEQAYYECKRIAPLH